MSICAPVLLVVFNRPFTTQKVFEKIREAGIKKLYISADAPRKENKEDELNCEMVKNIIMKVDWGCNVKYRFSKTNQGCGWGVYNAIDWAFKYEDRLIILEDDCIPALPFFSYCDELLEKYFNDTRIWIISGNQYNEEAVTSPHSYFFSRYGQSQGWATWKRCWKEMDMSLSKYPVFLQQGLLKSAYIDEKEASFFKRKFDRIYNDDSLKSNIWDFQFNFVIRTNGGLSIVPRKNLVSNIGYIGTHSNTKCHFHDRPVDESFKIISHPDFILPDLDYDRYHFKYFVNISKKGVFRNIKSLIKKLLKFKFLNFHY